MLGVLSAASSSTFRRGCCRAPLLVLLAVAAVAAALLPRCTRRGATHYPIAAFLGRLLLRFASAKQVEEIFAVVEAAARAASPPGSPPACVCGGSYRRGKPTSGDVDVVMTNNDERVRRVILPKMLDTMRQQGAHHLAAPLRSAYGGLGNGGWHRNEEGDDGS